MDFKTISRMTLGTVQLGMDYGIANKEGKPDLKKAFSILDKALEYGVNCLDTAAGYGDSEKVIGEYLKSGGISRDSIFISTKFKLGEIKENEAQRELIESVERSLVNLKTDYVDFILLHDAKEYLKYKVQIDSAISKLKNLGLIRNAGASGYSLQEIEPLLENDMYDAFQMPVNILDQRNSDANMKERLGGKTVFARSIYLQGLFFMEPEELKGNLSEISGYITKIRELASGYGVSTAQLAVCYVSSLGYVTSLVIGADNPRQVAENARMVEEQTFGTDRMKEIRKELKGAPDWLFYPWLWDKMKG
ncbi:MAG: aldo/keto reductase [Clostridia bacterium]